MLLPDESNWDFLSVAVGERNTEDRFTHEDAFGMVAKRPVSEVGMERLALVEPLMDLQVVFDLPAVLPHTGNCVVIGMSHLALRFWVTLSVGLADPLNELAVLLKDEPDDVRGLRPVALTEQSGIVQ